MSSLQDRSLADKALATWEQCSTSIMLPRRLCKDHPASSEQLRWLLNAGQVVGISLLYEDYYLE